MHYNIVCAIKQNNSKLGFSAQNCIESIVTVDALEKSYNEHRLVLLSVFSFAHKAQTVLKSHFEKFPHPSLWFSVFSFSSVSKTKLHHSHSKITHLPAADIIPNRLSSFNKLCKAVSVKCRL